MCQITELLHGLMVHSCMQQWKGALTWDGRYDQPLLHKPLLPKLDKPSLQVPQGDTAEESPQHGVPEAIEDSPSANQSS